MPFFDDERGEERKDVSELGAGDIGATVKLKNTHTGDTLASAKRPVVLPTLQFPEPVMREAITPRAKGDEEKMSTGLTRLHEEDPSFRVEVDPELGTVDVTHLIPGMQPQEIATTRSRQVHSVNHIFMILNKCQFRP